jgi:hypothetical protein
MGFRREKQVPKVDPNGTFHKARMAGGELK